MQTSHKHVFFGASLVILFLCSYLTLADVSIAFDVDVQGDLDMPDIVGGNFMDAGAFELEIPAKALFFNSTELAAGDEDVNTFNDDDSQLGERVSSASVTEWLRAHNVRRASGGSPALRWSNKLADSAQAWATRLRMTGCSLRHSNKRGVGENIASGYNTIEQVLRGWADSEARYYQNGRCVGGECGHYTQVMWKATQLVGCGASFCSSTRLVYVCQYVRPGNCHNYNWHQANSDCPYFNTNSL